ncbi:hypothetical protein GDO81_003399 [Engystomops pustulosus]|uniref:Uncharacterized protein n=1 Tax=Engystomops pustulosus TaxID=76066 RepID=A0AAV6ZWN0_ENGPU|nr:hypothetical protein GDO81_003399 [Engystomops pustulosus]
MSHCTDPSSTGSVSHIRPRPTMQEISALSYAHESHFVNLFVNVVPCISTWLPYIVHFFLLSRFSHLFLFF